MRRKQPERALQQAAADYLNLALPDDAFFSSIPGGDGRATLTPGYVSGLPDAVLIYRGTSIFIEFKTEKGRVSDAQAWCHIRLGNAGAEIAVIRSLDDLERLLDTFEIDTKAKVAA